MNKVENIDVRDEILAYLKEEERSLAWLAKKIDVNYNTMYSIFVQKVIRLSKKNIKKINESLNTSFQHK